MYCQNCGAEIPEGNSYCPKCGHQVGESPIQKEITVQPTDEDVSPKSRLATTLLAVFLGEFGAHRFYIGKTGSATTMLLLGIFGFIFLFAFGLGIILLVAVSIWALVDFIMAVCGYMKDVDDKLIKKW